MSDKSTALLSFDNVGLLYPNGTLALDAVTLSLAAGQFVGVVGPSGCGKSTLLRLAAGLLPATHGTVDRATDRVGYVFQDPTLLPWRSVRRNVELVGELSGMSAADRRTRATEALRRVGLADVADQRPRALSGGMRMRASLARALTTHPDLFLFDEPFAAVDELTRARLGDDLQGLFLTDRFGALFVTHSVAEAVYLCQRVVVMADRPGRILGEVEVPAPYPRPPEVRYSTEFAHWCASVASVLNRTAATVHTAAGAQVTS
jgi:NitT/TauT family transport system ATP-binding protein